jgi:Outer membrane protein beta-barrel domain
MKSISVAIVLCALAATFVRTASAADNAFQLSDKVVSAGLGVGLSGLYGSSTLPPIFVAFETGINATPKKFTVGGLFAYAGSSEEFGFGKWSYTYIIIEGRGAYHFLENNKQFDAYGGVGIGYNIVSSSVTYTDPNVRPFGFSASGSYFIFDIFAGGRYYFAPSWAALAEVGYGVGFLRLGISHKI